MEMITRSRRSEGPGASLSRMLYPWVYRFIQLALSVFLKPRYNMSAVNRRVLRAVGKPYLVLPNHSSFWDPFFISIFVREPIYWIASDAQFRGFLRHLLRMIGAVPKSKGVSDIETIRSIMDIRRRNGVIGIFPEGVRTWDGHSLSPILATAKLIKLLKIPVIVPIIHGGGLSFPRWARTFRKGEVTISFHLGFTAAEIRSLSVEEIYGKLSRLLEYDAYQYQLEHLIPFRGKKQAEFLELVLFVCPQCNETGTLKSAGDQFWCRTCGYRVAYNEYGFLDKRSKRFYFSSIHEWNVWQLHYLKSWFSENYRRCLSESIFSGNLVWVWMGYRSKPLKRLKCGCLLLFSDRIVFTSLRNRVFVFPVSGIEGVNVQLKERLEFYYDGDLYQFRFNKRSDSAYKWQEAVRILAGMGTQVQSGTAPGS
jgi:1-acyl-sn-glycerol-3-phosphate acyltransferase